MSGSGVKDAVFRGLSPIGSGGTKLYKAEVKEVIRQATEPEATDKVDPATGKVRNISAAEYAELQPLLALPVTSTNFSRAGAKAWTEFKSDLPNRLLPTDEPGPGPGPGGDVTPISPPGAKRPVMLNGAGWPVIDSVSAGKPSNVVIEEGFYRVALTISRAQQSQQGVPALASLSLQSKNDLVQNGIDTLKLIAASNGSLPSLSEEKTNQLKSSVLTTLWYLFTTIPSGSQLSSQIHQTLLSTAENETNKFFGRAQVKQMLREPYQAKLGAADKADVKAVFGEKYGDKFPAKNILDQDGYISWEHVAGHGEGFYKSFIKNAMDKTIEGAKFKKTGSTWNSTSLELTFPTPKVQSDGTVVKGIRLDLRNFSDDMFGAVGKKKGFSYGGHSNIGNNQENSVKDALLKGLEANQPQLALLGLCAGLDNLDEDLKALGNIEIITTFDSSYFWKGTLVDENGNQFEGVKNSEDMEALVAVWKGLIHGDDYEAMEKRVDSALDQFYWVEHSGVDLNYVFPTLATHKSVRWLHLDGDSDGVMDAADVFYQFGLKKAQTNSDKEFQLIDSGHHADELEGTSLKNAVLDLNVATHYNSQTSSNSQVEHKFMANGFFEAEDSNALLRFTQGTNPFNNKPVFKVDYNSNLAHSSRSALEALTAYSAVVEFSDQGKISGLNEVDRKLMGLAVVAFALSNDDQSRFNDQRIWTQLLKAMNLPADLPYGPMVSLIDAEHHDYSGNLTIVKKYREQLSATTVAALGNDQVGRGYQSAPPAVA